MQILGCGTQQGPYTTGGTGSFSAILLRNVSNLNDRQKAEKFLLNGGAKQQERTIKQYLKKFSWIQVVAHKHSEEFEKEIEKLAQGASKGSQRYISSYQTALKKLTTKYEATLKHEYEQIAESWSTAGPPPEQRPKLLEKHCDHVVLEFAQTVYRLFGMRVFVLGTYKDKEGKPSMMR